MHDVIADEDVVLLCCQALLPAAVQRRDRQDLLPSGSDAAFTEHAACTVCLAASSPKEVARTAHQQIQQADTFHRHQQNSKPLMIS